MRPCGLAAAGVSHAVRAACGDAPCTARRPPRRPQARPRPAAPLPLPGAAAGRRRRRRPRDHRRRGGHAHDGDQAPAGAQDGCALRFKACAPAPRMHFCAGAALAGRGRYQLTLCAARAGVPIEHIKVMLSAIDQLVMGDKRWVFGCVKERGKGRAACSPPHGRLGSAERGAAGGGAAQPRPPAHAPTAGPDAMGPPAPRPAGRCASRTVGAPATSTLQLPRRRARASRARARARRRAAAQARGGCCVA